MVSQHDALHKKYPNAAYYDVPMIAAALKVPMRTVRYHCKKMFPCWNGHYRFCPRDLPSQWLLTHENLEWLLDCLAQQKKRRILLKK